MKIEFNKYDYFQVVPRSKDDLGPAPKRGRPPKNPKN